jgi:hypothetical protein
LSWEDRTCFLSIQTRGTRRVKVTGTRPKIVVSADGRGVVGHAGARLLADVADATGLTGCGDALADLRAVSSVDQLSAEAGQAILAENRAASSRQLRPHRRLVFQALPSGDCGQSLAYWRARARNAATLTSWGDGAAEAGEAGWDVRADAWQPMADVAPPEGPASATTPRQARRSAGRPRPRRRMSSWPVRRPDKRRRLAPPLSSRSRMPKPTGPPPRPQGCLRHRCAAACGP